MQSRIYAVSAAVCLILTCNHTQAGRIAITGSDLQTSLSAMSRSIREISNANQTVTGNFSIQFASALRGIESATEGTFAFHNKRWFLRGNNVLEVDPLTDTPKPQKRYEVRVFDTATTPSLALTASISDKIGAIREGSYSGNTSIYRYGLDGLIEQPSLRCIADYFSKFPTSELYHCNDTGNAILRWSEERPKERGSRITEELIFDPRLGYANTSGKNWSSFGEHVTTITMKRLPDGSIFPETYLYVSHNPNITIPRITARFTNLRVANPSAIDWTEFYVPENTRMNVSAGLPQGFVPENPIVLPRAMSLEEILEYAKTRPYVPPSPSASSRPAVPQLPATPAQYGFYGLLGLGIAALGAGLLLRLRKRAS